MRSRRRWAWVALAMLSASLSVLSAQAAPPAGQSATGESRDMRLFNIPAQPLRSALEAFSVVTGNQLIYDSRLAATRNSNRVVGLFTPETALRTMLEGTDLTILYTGPSDVTLIPAGVLAREAGEEAADLAASGGAVATVGGTLTLDTLYVDVPPGAAARPDFTEYGRTVRLEIKKALARDSDTAGRAFNVQLELWIDEAGRVQRPSVVRSTGAVKLDDAIRQALAAVVLKNPPPREMPQPIRVTIIAI